MVKYSITVIKDYFTLETIITYSLLR